MDHYSLSYRPLRDVCLSWLCWLTDSGQLNHKVVTHPASSLAQYRKSLPADTSVLTTMLRHQLTSLLLSLGTKKSFPNCFLCFPTRAPQLPRRCRLVSYSSTHFYLQQSQFNILCLVRWPSKIFKCLPVTSVGKLATGAVDADERREQLSSPTFCVAARFSDFRLLAASAADIRRVLIPTCSLSQLPDIGWSTESALGLFRLRTEEPHTVRRFLRRAA